jgi:eukaryotic-like serine/threonine-protein kinase
MLPSDSARDGLLERLAEEFVERHRRGERPALSEYTDRHPDLAAEIRELFPAMVQIESLKPRAGELTEASTPTSPSPDQHIPERFGEYRILRQIGQGGMGIVYEAEQESLGRHVALKVLPRHPFFKATYLERFRREAKAAGRLHHTNIVPVFGVGACDGTHYYAMQFIAGESLDKVLRDLRRLRNAPASFAAPTERAEGSVAQSLLTGRFEPPLAPPAEKSATSSSPALVIEESRGASTLSAGGSDSGYYRGIARVGLQVAEALAYAHRQGILHRDIKPSNLLLDQQGTVWVADFGLAKAEGADDLTQAGDIVGTVRYMAPERFDGHSLPQSDVYALGVTLYELLTLRPAFDHVNRERLVDRVLHEPPVRPRKLDPHIPRDLETMVLKCLAKDPAERYASADRLAEDLRRFLADRPILARRSTWRERSWRWCRRNPAVASLLGTVAALLVALAGVSTFYAVHQQAAATDLAEALRDSEAKRWESLRDQARARRMSRQPGQRIRSLQAIQEAMQLPLPPGHSLDELRTEAIAALALPDVEVLQQWQGWTTGTNIVEFDGELDRYARLAMDGTVTVRRVSDDVETARWQEQTQGPWPHDDGNLRFSPDGRFLCIRHGGSGRLTVRRLDGPEPVLCCQGTGAHTGFAMEFSPDSNRLAYLRTDSRIAVVDLTSGQTHCLPSTGAEDQTDIRFAPDGRRFAVWISRGGKSAIEVRDAVTGQVLPSPSEHDIGGQPAWHPDGQTLATCSNRDRLIRVWDLASGKLLRVLEGHKNDGLRCAFSHNGCLLVSNDWSGLLRVWEPSSGRQLLSFPAQGYAILRLSSDDRVAAVDFADPARLQLLRLHGGQEYRTIGPRSSRREDRANYGHLTVHPAGRLLAAAAPDDRTVLIDLAAGREVGALPGRYEWPLLWEPTGDLLTYGPSGCLRWSVVVDSMDPGRYRLGPPQLLFGVQCLGFASCVDDRTIAIGNHNEGALVVHRGTSTRVIHLQPQQDVRSCAVSPDGRWVATGSHTNTDGVGAKVWDAATGRLVKDFRVPGLCRVAFSPDGRWLLTDSGGCQLWEVGSWKEGPKIGGAHGCFSPDGQIVAVEDSPGAVRLVHSENGGELARLEAPEQTPLQLGCFIPDGTRLIAVGVDNRALHVWDLRRVRKELIRLGLDWDAPPYPEADDRLPEPIQIRVVSAERTQANKR